MDVPLGQVLKKTNKHVYFNVLILIVMDVPLGQWSCDRLYCSKGSLNPYCNGCASRTFSKSAGTMYKSIVLILIVMDVPLGLENKEAQELFPNRLNPYCNGCASRTADFRSV